VDTVTSLTLLEGLRDPCNAAAWQRFVDRYEPLVLCFARKLGLGDSDARDAGQETMLAFVRAYRDGAYHRSRGRLRSWLFGVARRKVLDIYRHRHRERVLADRSNGTAFLEAIESPDDAERVWEQEWERAVLRACLAEVARHADEEAMQCFRLYVLEGWAPEKVAAHLGVSRNAVYIHKSRVIGRLHDLQRQMEEVWG